MSPCTDAMVAAVRPFITLDANASQASCFLVPVLSEKVAKNSQKVDGVLRGVRMKARYQ